ncbi:hypothetical protein BT69DRAFT_1352926, partial [Atractiella rhizophila]
WTHPPTLATGDTLNKPRADSKSKSTGWNTFCLKKLFWRSLLGCSPLPLESSSVYYTIIGDSTAPVELREQATIYVAPNLSLHFSYLYLFRNVLSSVSCRNVSYE